jgi:hypothetical protein
MVNVYNICINSNYNNGGNATVPSVGVQVIRFTVGLFLINFSDVLPRSAKTCATQRLRSVGHLTHGFPMDKPTGTCG